MQPALSISANWEELKEGTPEEKACFAALGIIGNNHWLTEGRDGVVNRIRTEPLLSAYHLAEWFAWNWWRLRWESRSEAPDWAFAHRMANIGHGYVWPNITIFSDGERTALIAKPSDDRTATMFRYISNYIAIVPSRVFENAVDQFVSQVLGQLQAENLDGTNVEALWSELKNERLDRDIAKRRKLEALLGQDPDQADQSIIDALLNETSAFGERSVEELAADHAQGGELLNSRSLRELAQSKGFAASPSGAARLAPSSVPVHRDIPAWKLGADAARALREQEQLHGAPIKNQLLAKLAGVEASALTSDTAGRNISFALDKNKTESRIVLGSRWETRRRFDLARLLAERIVTPPPGKLHVATRSYTYRQKMQRSFAAEFLCPIEDLEDFLSGDYSFDRQKDAAEHFVVSDRTVETLLLNHKRLHRDELDEDFGEAA